MAPTPSYTVLTVDRRGCYYLLIWPRGGIRCWGKIFGILRFLGFVIPDRFEIIVIEVKSHHLSIIIFEIWELPSSDQFIHAVLGTCIWIEGNAMEWLSRPSTIIKSFAWKKSQEWGWNFSFPKIDVHFWIEILRRLLYLSIPKQRSINSRSFLIPATMIFWSHKDLSDKKRGQIGKPKGAKISDPSRRNSWQL